MKLVFYFFTVIIGIQSNAQSADSIVLIELTLYISDYNSPNKVHVSILEGDSLFFSDTIHISRPEDTVLVTKCELSVNSKYTILFIEREGMLNRSEFDTYGITKPTRFIREVSLISRCRPLILPKLEFEQNAFKLTRLQETTLLQLCSEMMLNSSIVVQIHFTYNNDTSKKTMTARNASVINFLELHLDYIERIVIKNTVMTESDQVKKEVMNCEIISFDYVSGK